MSKGFSDQGYGLVFHGNFSTIGGMERAKLSVSPMFQEQLRQELLSLYPAEEKTEQHCRYRLDFTTSQGWVRVKQFANGTLYVEATDAGLYRQILGVIQRVTGQTATVKAASITPSSSHITAERGKIELDVPYIGTDESGKGDYFGPLVIAGVYTTPETAEQLLSLGVKDSKQLKDGQMKTLASEIQRVVGPSGWHIIEIGPKRYNELYERFKQGGKNLNHLLAWGHSKVLEMLLEKNPNCTHAIADQFGSEHYIRSQLQTRGQQIQLHQTPKAEANVGVAAASVLARVRFVQKLGQLGTSLGVTLPLGAGSQVVARAREITSTRGVDALREIAKLHFKTTEALGV